MTDTSRQPRRKLRGQVEENVQRYLVAPGTAGRVVSLRDTMTVSHARHCLIMLLTPLVTALRDRLNAWRMPGARSAIQRQEQYLEGKGASDRRWKTLDTPEGAVTARVATHTPVDQTVVPFPDDALAAVTESAALAMAFVHAHLRRFDGPTWSLQDLDDAFANWSLHGDKEYYTADAVEQIVGSAFGEFCVRALGMRWVLVTDAYGTAAAVEAARRNSGINALRSFPFAVVNKRISAGESHFLMGIFRHLEAELAR